MPDTFTKQSITSDLAHRVVAAAEVAQDKACTAVGFGLPTDGWYDFIKDDPPLDAAGG
ncbi:MAG: hypothetical protein M3357_19955 [Actinomycetota bacterium]|nr:hypothetical protein [Actinomycetota bacterium]